jgi:hypothetical protein
MSEMDSYEAHKLAINCPEGSFLNAFSYLRENKGLGPAAYAGAQFFKVYRCGERTRDIFFLSPNIPGL